jgi:hypothetical protein
MAPGVGGALGVGVDLEAITVAARLGVAYHHTSNPQLTIRQGRVGAEVSGVRKSDVGALAVGLGLRSGLDLTRQGFDTAGLAPARSALSGRVGPVVAVDLRMGTRQTLSLIGAADIQVYRRYDAIEQTERLASIVVPSLSLELARYVR